MNKAHGQVINPSAPLTGSSPLAAALVYCLLVGLAFYDTVASMVAIWARSQTFAHGFIILPISLWLLWRQRQRFRGVAAHPQPWALLLVAASGLAWLFANMVDVLVVQQLAFVAMIISGTWAITGTALTRRAAFPLGFLFLAVPMGEGLIPPLMDLTAATTEAMVRATGIPVYREGMYLFLPSGTWSVIAECSGVRYLVASLTLGLLYAYLIYHSLWRRLIFILMSILVPIAANSVRAYGVVMLGHISDMEFATGDDHLVYGWVFFGLVILLMFWIGGFWQQRRSFPPTAGPVLFPASRRPAPSMILCTLLAVICAALWPALALTLNRNPVPAVVVPLAPPAPAQDWRLADGQDWPWQPAAEGADRELDQLYSAARPVGLHLRQHLRQRPGIELVSTADPWRPDRTLWRVVGRRSVQLDLATPVSVDEAIVASDRHQLLVWSWYRIAGKDTANPYAAKLLEAKQQILAGRRFGTRVFVATPVDEDPVVARQVLLSFLSAHRPALEALLDADVTDGADVTASDP